MAFTAKILSWRFCHLNIVGCFLKRRPTKEGSRAPQDPPLATPLKGQSKVKHLFTDTGLIPTPRYYGQFSFSLHGESPYIFYKFNSPNTDGCFLPNQEILIESQPHYCVHIIISCVL